MKKILVMIDLQNDFIDGVLGSPEAKEAEKCIVEDLDFTEFSHIYLTKDTHFNAYMNTLEGKYLPVPHCIHKTLGWENSTPIMNKLNASCVPYTIAYKHTFGFTDWDIYSDADEIVIVGVCTDICVISNALILRALYPNKEIKVISRMCAGTTIEKHKEALDIMRSCQIEVIE